MHLRFAAALLVLGALPHAGAASEVAAVAVASYDLTARLDPELQRVEASGTLRWQNASSLPAERLCVHLYLNAFRSADSTFLRGAEPWLAGELASGGWGGIDLGRLRDGADRDLLGRLTFASPDDGNPADATLAWVELAEPVPPGGELTLAMEWTARLPALVDRVGQLDDFAMVAQWYPKVGRRRADGLWSCHQFHATSEFSADFGDYRVALDVPAGWEVGATGMAETAPVEAAGRRRLAFAARGVHDFAWAASPDWAVETRVLPRPGREPVQLRLLLQPSSRRAANRLSGTLAYGLRRLEEQLGPYPYPSLTVVEPPPGGETATAMEYPTLFTLMVSPISDRAFELEETALHELAHQWWQGMVATDEVEEPFLDEGLATYSAARLLAERSGGAAPGLRLLGWRLPLPGRPLDPFEQLRLRWRAGRPSDPVARSAWGYRDAASYGALAYDGMALTLAQLERLLGRETFDRGLARFAARGRFGHPSADDLARELSAAAGEDLSELWHELTRRTGRVDYAVAEARSEPVRGSEEFASSVIVERRGELRLPLEIELRFADGATRRAVWDGRDEWVRVRAVGPRLVEARLDPDRRLLLDADRLDDTRRVVPDPRPRRAAAQRLRFLLQLLLEALADLA